MVYRGTVKKGVLVLDDSAGLADGTEVTVRPVKTKAKPRAKPKVSKKPQKLRRGLMKFEGNAKGLPSDASRNVDHDLNGHAKQ